MEDRRGMLKRSWTLQQSNTEVWMETTVDEEAVTGRRHLLLTGSMDSFMVFSVS